ncbi:MAG TPA: alpha/beta hydrolase [Puia sp.]|jgi:acetyl esterase/lipase
MDKKLLLLAYAFFGLIPSGRSAVKFPEADTVKRMLVTYDLEYGRKLNDRQQAEVLTLDVYEPRDDRTQKPVIILVHGGGFGSGDKQEDLFVKMATAFAGHEYLVFVVNYRLKGPGIPCGQEVLERAVSDVADAVNWIKKNRKRFKADTSRMIICGDSAGGAIAVNLCFDQARDRTFAGCIDLWGGMCNPPGPGYAHRLPWSVPVYEKQLSGEIPPVCIIHGTSDEVVPYSTSTELSAQLSSKGIYNELHSLEGARHFPEQKAVEFIPVMIAFSDKVISGKANKNHSSL